MADDNVKCVAPGCEADATSFPVLQLVPSKGYKGTPWEVVLAAPLCPDHCQPAKPQEYIVDALWLDLCARARARQLRPPKRGLTRVRFVPIDPAPGRQVGGVDVAVAEPVEQN